jgi:hypothetical protein
MDLAELGTMDELREGLMELAATLTAYKTLPRKSTPRRPSHHWCWWTLTPIDNATHGELADIGNTAEGTRKQTKYRRLRR